MKIKSSLTANVFYAIAWWDSYLILRRNNFELIPFQSPKGQQVLLENNIPTKQLDTVILIDSQRLHTHSDDFLRIVSKIPKWQRVAALLAFVPRMLRDYVYRTASRNRVKLFGKSKTCTISQERV